MGGMRDETVVVNAFFVAVIGDISKSRSCGQVSSFALFVLIFLRKRRGALKMPLPDKARACF